MKIRIIGLGSLLSEKSAKSTCPTLQNFQIVKLYNYKRVFNKVNSTLVFKGTLPSKGKAYACLSAMPSEGTAMYVSTFEIDSSEWLAFVQREFEYKLMHVPIEVNGEEVKGVLCYGEYKNDEECALICSSDPFRFQRWAELQEKYKGFVWRKDLLPEPIYLENCLKISMGLGCDVYNNFIETTFLGDGETSIAEYLALGNVAVI